ncbi:MAG: M48 family metallopeptidase [Flavobacterium sp.]|nr:M48 family metallopeptidase [Flavobacterium sp.]MBP8156944.1 M48 family metallopeptidase [Flavobacterium sp.]
MKTILSYSQTDIVPIDSISNQACKSELFNTYKKKFENINKNYVYPDSNQKNIIKEINVRSQSQFLESISEDDYLCSNETLTYLQSLFDEVLSKNKIDATNYRILLSKETEVNAFNFGEGTVVVNYGLFLAIENEDELIFVISHEIGHQYLNHVKKEIEEYAKLSTSKEIAEKTKEIEKQKYKKASKANDLLKNITYQSYSKRRKKEIEADSLGLVFYKKTMRNPKAGVKLLEKLEDSDREKDSLTVDDFKLIFEENGFKIKEKFFVEEEESLFKKYDSEKRINADSLKSHPDCSTRIQLVKKYLNNKLENDNYSKSSKFDNIKKNSINQNLLHLFSGKKYGYSLYEALKLYKKDKSNSFFKQIIFLSLTELYKSRTNYTINKYVPTSDKKNFSNSLNRYIHFLNNIKLSDYELLIANFNPEK